MSASSKKIEPENCFCPESCCPSSSSAEIKYLLRVCYIEWGIMGILSMLIMAKMTDLEDDEWVWYKIFTGMLIIFSIPFTVGFHEHTDPSCDCQVQQEEKSPQKKTRQYHDWFGLTKKTRKSSKKIKKLRKSSKKRQPVFGLIKPVKKANVGQSRHKDVTESSSETESSSSSTKVTKQHKTRPQKMLLKKDPKKTTVTINEEIFKKFDDEEERTVEASLEIQKEPSLTGGEDKFNYQILIDVDPDEEDHMSVNVQGQVDGGDMDVTTHAATEGEGKADVRAGIRYGVDEDEDKVEMSVSEDSTCSSDEMKLRAGNKTGEKTKKKTGNTSRK